MDAVSASASSAMRCRGIGAGRGGAMLARVLRRQLLHVGEGLREIDVAVGLRDRRRRGLSPRVAPPSMLAAGAGSR